MHKFVWYGAFSLYLNIYGINLSGTFLIEYSFKSIISEDIPVIVLIYKQSLKVS